MHVRCAHLGCHNYITEGKYCQQHLPANASSSITEDDDGPSLLGTVVAAELLSEALSSPDPAPDVSTPDAGTPDFGGFGGGDSGGGGAGGDF